MATQQPVALVSGSDRGIGRGIARGLAERGHEVIVTARDGDRARHAAEELSDSGRLSLRAEQLDVAAVDSVERVAEVVAADPGRLDVLVNNVGVQGVYDSDAATAPLDDAHLTIETNLFGAWRLAQAVLLLLRRS